MRDCIRSSDTVERSSGVASETPRYSEGRTVGRLVPAWRHDGNKPESRCGYARSPTIEDMSSVWKRIGGWRRVVLTLAIFGVAMALWERDRRVEVWSLQVVQATQDLVAGGVAVESVDPGRKLLVETAERSIASLVPPRTIGTVMTVETEGNGTFGEILVTGADGRAVRLRFTGASPMLVRVDRIDAEAPSNSIESGARP